MSQEVVIARTIALALPTFLQSQLLQVQSLRVLGHVDLTGFPRTTLAILLSSSFHFLNSCDSARKSSTAILSSLASKNPISRTVIRTAT